MKPYELLTEYEKFAVIGMHPDNDKYAYKIYQLLKDKGKTVYGLNPKYKEAAGDTLYMNLNELNKEIDIAVFVVNPKIGIKMLEDMKEHQIKHVWLQPGTVDKELLDKAKELKLNVTEACVLATYAKHEPNN